MKLGRKQRNMIASSLIVLTSGFGLASEATDSDRFIEVGASTQFHEIHPGETGLLAITLDIKEGWHTYWPGVSDSGFGITLDIRPTGPVTLGEIIWPTPHRYLQPGDILDHVYEESAMILVPFTVKDDASTNDVILFDIHADYLVCSNMCLPEQGDATTTISIIDSSKDKLPTSNADQIKSAYESRPIAFDPTSETVRVQWIPGAAALMFQGAKKVEFYPSKECTELADPIAGPITNSDRLVIKFTSKDNSHLIGRLHVQGPTGTVDYDIDIKPDIKPNEP